MDRRRFVKSVGCAGTFAAATQLPVGARDRVELSALNRLPSAGGMGYVVLDKDKTFAEQVTQENTIYEIRYDFDLGGGADPIRIPAGCVLKFEGGSLKNGTLVGANTSVLSAPTAIFMPDLNIEGTFVLDKAFPEWFSGNSDADKITRCTGAFQKCHLGRGTYTIDKEIILDNASIIGYDKSSTIVKYANENALLNIAYASQLNNITIKPYASTTIGLLMEYTRLCEASSVIRDVVIEYVDLKDESVGVLMRDSKGVGMYRAMLQNIEVKRADIAFSIEAKKTAAGVRGWVNTNYIDRCVAWSCGSALKLYTDATDNTGSVIWGNSIDITFQNAVSVTYANHKCVYMVDGEGIERNVISGYIWDLDPNNVKGSLLGNVGNNIVLKKDVTSFFLYKEKWHFLGTIRKPVSSGYVNVHIDIRRDSGELIHIRMRSNGTSITRFTYSEFSYSVPEIKYIEIDDIYYIYISRTTSGYNNIDVLNTINFTPAPFCGYLSDSSTIASLQTPYEINEEFRPRAILAQTAINTEDHCIGTMLINENIRGVFWLYPKNNVLKAYDGLVYGAKRYGGTTERPSAEDGIYQGFQYFDTTLGKPIWWNGTDWVDATGTKI